MKLPQWIFPGFRNRLARRRAVQEVRFQVRNLTRRTILADSLLVADSSSTRSKGLLGRAALPPGEGLWILPCESVHTFGMQFSIDLVYLDRNLRIRKVRSSVPPWRISACFRAHSVLELPAGTVRETGTIAGDTLEFSDAAMAGANPAGFPDASSQNRPEANRTSGTGRTNATGRVIR